MASFDYNPITGQLDLVGSGGGSYIDGEVEYHSNLPVIVGTPAVNSAFLVRKGEGLYFISRKPAGIWVRELNNGNLDDWKFAGLFSDLYRDANFRIISDSDVSKELAFDVSGVTTGTTRTLTVPNASGRIQVEGQAIGNTTPAAGTFTTLSANNGTLTASAPVLDLSQTWNNAAVEFTGLRLNVTDTASAANGTRLLDLQVGGVSQVRVERNTNTWELLGGGANDNGIGFGSSFIYFRNFLGVNCNIGSNTAMTLRSDYSFGFSSTTNPSLAPDVVLNRDAADTLAQRRTTNPQTFRLYNTFTDASNHERGFMRWSSNVLQIGTEKAGTGSARALEFQTDGTTRLTIATSGVMTTSAGVDVNGQTSSSNGFHSGGWVGFTSSGFRLQPARNIAWVTAQWNAAGVDLVLERDAANALAQRNGASAQTFRLYNTFTDASNHERGFMRWSSNVLQIGTEAAGTGSARALELQTGGVTRYTISTTGNFSSQNSRIVLDETNSVAHFGNSPRFSVYYVNNQYVAIGGGTGLRFATGRSDQASIANLELIRDADAVLAQRAGTNAQTFRIYNTVSGTNNVNFDRVNFRWASNEFIIDAEAGGTGTLRGIKIGSATSSLLGFYGVTPVDQPATVADPTGGGTVDAEARTAINDIIDRLQELGLIA